jgi:hypothetical protein
MAPLPATAAIESSPLRSPAELGRMAKSDRLTPASGTPDSVIPRSAAVGADVVAHGAHTVIFSPRLQRGLE